ncbi:unnamed protein product [Arabidopsis halleri]
MITLEPKKTNKKTTKKNKKEEVKQNGILFLKQNITNDYLSTYP